MKRYFRQFTYAFIALLLILISGPVTAVAASSTPIMDKANITITPQGQDVRTVTEQVNLSDIGTVKGSNLEFILASLSGATVSNLTIKSSSGAIPFTQKNDQALTKISVPVPSGVQSLGVTIQYTVQSATNSHIPLVVPMYSPSGIKDAVSLNFALPSGMYLHSSTPNYDGPKQGTINESLVAIPSFVSFNYGPSPQLFNFNGLMSGTVLVLIFAAVAVWLISAMKKTGGAKNV